MNQEWEIWLRGGRKGYILQKIERVLGTKVQNLSESVKTLGNEKITVLNFDLALKSNNYELGIFEGLKMAEKLHHIWHISGVTNKQIFCSCNEEYFAITEIKYAHWKLTE